MNKQKGFIGISLMIWIIVGLIAAGTAVYVAKHNGASTARDNYPKEVASPKASGIAIDESGTHLTSPGAGIAIDDAGVHIALTAPIPGATVNVGGQVSGSQSDGWFYVQELHARFKNIAGFTPQYSVGVNPNGVIFTSKEFREQAIINKDLAGCVNSPFGVVSFTSKSKAESDWQGYVEIVLGVGKYLNFTGHQDACWYSGTPYNSEENTRDQTYMNTQFKLFNTFLHSAESY